MGAIPVDSNNKRIAINTVFLYIRLCVMMVITLFSSRVLLQNLGISDYGVYNAVCGIVLFFSFINGTLTGGTQRYLNFSIGRGNKFYISSILFFPNIPLNILKTPVHPFSFFQCTQCIIMQNFFFIFILFQIVRIDNIKHDQNRELR